MALVYLVVQSSTRAIYFGRDLETTCDSETTIQKLFRPIQKLFRPIQKLSRPIQKLLWSPIQKTISPDPIQKLFRPIQQLLRSPIQKPFRPIQKLFRPIQKLFRPIHKLCSRDSESFLRFSRFRNCSRTIQKLFAPDSETILQKLLPLR